MPSRVPVIRSSLLSQPKHIAGCYLITVDSHQPSPSSVSPILPHFISFHHAPPPFPNANHPWPHLLSLLISIFPFPELSSFFHPFLIHHYLITHLFPPSIQSKLLTFFCPSSSPFSFIHPVSLNQPGLAINTFPADESGSSAHSGPTSSTASDTYNYFFGCLSRPHTLYQLNVTAAHTTLQSIKLFLVRIIDIYLLQVRVWP